MRMRDTRDVTGHEGRDADARYEGRDRGITRWYDEGQDKSNMTRGARWGTRQGTHTRAHIHARTRTQRRSPRAPSRGRGGTTSRSCLGLFHLSFITQGRDDVKKLAATVNVSKPKHRAGTTSRSWPQLLMYLNLNTGAGRRQEAGRNC